MHQANTKINDSVNPSEYIASELNRLAELRKQFEYIQSEIFSRTKKLHADLHEVEKEMEFIEKNVKYLIENTVKSSVSGNVLMAVYSQGRITWDSAGLDGYALVHPEILSLKKVGKPSVTIRRR